MGMSVVAPGWTRTRLASLLGGTALVSVAALSMTVTGARAACTVSAAGTVDCLAATTTTNTLNTNGATNPSSDKVQEFSNGANITGTIAGAVTVDGFGLQLQLTNVGPNTIGVTNSGTVTTDQNNALELNGNGGLVTYAGTGTVSTTAGGGNAMVATNAGDITVTNNGVFSSVSNYGLFVQTTLTGTINVNGSGAISGQVRGVVATASGAGNINVTSGGGIVGVTDMGIRAQSSGGNVLVATGSTVSGGDFGIVALTTLNGTVTVTTGGAVTGTNLSGILTGAQNGATSVNVGHNLTGGFYAIFSTGSGSGLIDINHTAGTIASGSTGIYAQQTGIGTIDISQTGGALNAAGFAVAAEMQGAGNVIVSLTGGTVSNVSGIAIETIATTGSTTITSGVALTSTAANAINATATSGNIAISNSSVVTGATNAINGSTSGTFDITNSGTLNGNVNVTGSNATSTFANSGTWNTGTASSVFTGSMSNTGTLNMQNGTAGHTVALSGNYSGNGAYRVDVDALGNADRLNVAGTATLTGGSVNSLFLPGAYITRNYTILSATGGLGGTTFTGGLTTTNLPAGFTASLSYTPTDVLLDLAAVLGVGGIGGNLNQNQQNVAGTINTYFNNGGALPPGFVTVFGLTGASLGNALTQLSGEHATGLQPAANLSTGMFLNAMLDPFVTGRSGGFGAVTGYAPEAPSRVAVATREAFAAYTKAPVALPFVERRWSVWGQAYGGRNRTDGDATVGSNDLRATAAGFAVGADYRVSPGTVIGAAVAVGENRWNVSDFGKGNAELAQFGGYFSSRWNSLYVSGAAAVASHRASTERTLNIAGIDRLTANFNATSFGGRLEGGYRFDRAAFGVTPYAAVQVTSIHTPLYIEVATAGLNQFALGYQAQSTTDTRTELGTWADTRHRFGSGALLTLRARAAWVHDYNPGSRVNAAFQTLPGAGFVVDGAAAPRDAALTSAVAELRMTNGWTLIGKFDGEFSQRSHTLAGTGTLKYAW